MVGLMMALGSGCSWFGKETKQPQQAQAPRDPCINCPATPGSGRMSRDRQPVGGRDEAPKARKKNGKKNGVAKPANGASSPNAVDECERLYDECLLKAK
jgi:hypothetical protein